jgi:ketosteroid isomerase-like protein
MPAAAGVPDNTAIARRLFELAERRDVPGYLEYMHPDVELYPLTGARDVYRGHEGVREFFRERMGEGLSTTPSTHRFVAEGDTVVVIGSVRRISRGGLADSSVAWVLRMVDGKLRDLRAYTSEREALEAAGIEPASGPG